MDWPYQIESSREPGKRIIIYVLSVHDSDCVPNIDVDECKLNTSRCDQICNNTAGSYTCSCNEGFLLHNDGYNCVGT